MDGDVEGFNIINKENAYTSPTLGAKKKNSGSFQSFGLSFPVLKGLMRRGYKVPTPIQRKSIPLILQGRDVVGMARTGSGKTACFLLPMFEKLMSKSPKIKSSVRALILSPTRELALQTVKFIRELGKFTNLKVLAVLGGESLEHQFSAIHNNPDIIVATPGRFLHLCVEMELKLTSVEYVVFDEADRLFEMGFGDQLKEILDRLGTERQTVLFSATLPKLLVDFSKAGLVNPILLRLDVDTKIPDTLDLVYLSVKQDEKLAALLCLLNALPKKAQTLIFAATKHHVEYLHKILDKAGISSTYIYSDLDATARKINAGKFQNKVCSVLIVTDVAARGVDIPHLDYVINYHFPAKSKLFVHRVGRCARAGRNGTAFSLVSTEEVPYLLDLHLFLGKKLNLIEKDIRVKKDEHKGEGGFGKIPSFLIETQQCELIIWHQYDEEIGSMRKVCENSYKKYLRSRPGALNESVKRAKEIVVSNVGVHYFFNEYVTDEGKTGDVLEKMKKYKPKGTVFELNLSNKSKCYSIMKKTKKVHEKYVIHFKKKLEENENKINDDEEEAAMKWIKEEPNNELGDNELGNTFAEIITGKKRKSKKNPGNLTKKKFKDDDFYVPHFAPDQHTEKGLSLNNFTSEANRFAFDLTGDCEKGLTMQKRIKKWDKKRKKVVGVPDQKTGKIKTESGNWISASYKSNRYEQWKEKTKIPEGDEDEDNNDDDDAAKVEQVRKKKINKNKSIDFPNTMFGRLQRKQAEKVKAKAGLLKPENIFKARQVLEKKQQKSIPRSKRMGNRYNAGKKNNNK